MPLAIPIFYILKIILLNFDIWEVNKNSFMDYCKYNIDFKLVIACKPV